MFAVCHTAQYVIFVRSACSVCAIENGKDNSSVIYLQPQPTMSSSKSVPQSPVSGASGHSSENSETQSVSDVSEQTSVNASNRSLNRRMSSFDVFNKSGQRPSKGKLSIPTEKTDEKRPPWRSVANPTPIKVNKNALLKAKILDATRRALLAQRIGHTGTQTEQPFSTAVLMREKQTDIQKDLIGLTDKSMETDGAVTLRQECPGGFIITQTIGQMTEIISCKDMATQTPLPKVNLSFSLLNKNNRPLPQKPKLTMDEKMYLNEQLLQSQMAALRNIDDKLKRKLSSDAYAMESMPANVDEQLYYERTDAAKYDNYGHQPVDFDASAYNQYVESFSARYNYNTSLDNLEATEANRKDVAMSSAMNSECSQQQVESRTRSFEPTLTSWEDFELSDEDSALPDLPRKSISEGSTPWNNFKDLVIGQRLANMHLSPLQFRPQTAHNIHRKNVSWNDQQQHAVSELLSEASALIDVFDQMSIILGPEVPLSAPSKSPADNLTIPPSKWEPILSVSCTQLEEKLRSFKPRAHGNPMIKRRTNR